MDTDFKSLELRYGTLLANKIQEEILRVEQRRFSFYKIPEAFRALRSVTEECKNADFPVKNSIFA